MNDWDRMNHFRGVTNMVKLGSDEQWLDTPRSDRGKARNLSPARDFDVCQHVEPLRRRNTFVLSVNIHRRHMTKGQRAMAVAKIFETNNATQTETAKTAQLSQARIAYAVTVLQYASDLADNVLNGSTSLDEANHKRSESQKGIPKAEKERAATDGGTTFAQAEDGAKLASGRATDSGTTTKPNRTTDAKAAASGTNRGSIERMGGMLKAMPKHPAGRPAKNQLQAATNSLPSHIRLRSRTN